MPRTTWTNVEQSQLLASQKKDEEAVTSSRRIFVATTAASIGGILTALPSTGNALVKGVAPPPKKSLGDKPKCTNVEECQAMAEKRDQELREKEELGPPPKVTSTGIKYRDMEDGSGEREVKDGDEVEVFYKVLKLGKRSYDGISGEGTVVFSRGRYISFIALYTCHFD